MARKKKYKRVKGVIGRAFNFQKWGNFDDWLSIALELLETIKNLFIPQAPKKKERLKSAMKRLKVSEQEVVHQKRALLFMAILTFCLGVGGLSYTIYMFSNGHYNAIALSMTTSVIAFAFAFRYHFWYFQLKKGKLGCSVTEWLKEGFWRKRQ